ncbi:hypothetical protein J2Z65_003546 [Paenibacillus aceris]|uniref:Uncharacterized protein n=1 Tax=Paenibacillus aceris TaxID=869555 RepID=A0ABS4I082_9BACL|nr:hypothetical protein [Paenibacillus aceris]
MGVRGRMEKEIEKSSPPRPSWRGDFWYLASRGQYTTINVK